MVRGQPGVSEVHEVYYREDRGTGSVLGHFTSPGVHLLRWGCGGGQGRVPKSRET